MRKYCALFICFCFMFALSGCNNEKDDIAINIPPTPSSDSLVPTPHHGQSSLRIVTNSNGRGVLLFSAATSNGYYENLPWVAEMYREDSPWIHISNILYTDYATNTRVYLCNTPGCAHNNENCTSYIRYPRGTVLFTDIAESMLFCMATGAMDGEVYSDEDLGRIYQMGLDGSDRKEIVRLKANESFSLSDPVLADDSHLYVCVVMTTDAKNEPVKEIRSIDIQTGKIEKLVELRYTELISSAYDNYFVIADFDSILNTVIYRGYSLVDKNFVNLYECASSDLVMIEGCYLFFATKKDDHTGMIKIIDMKTGDEQNLENIPHDAIGSIELYNYFDEKIHWNYIDTSGESIAHEYIIDCKTGAYQEKTLRYDELGVQRMVQILADTGDSFLVLTGAQNSTITLTDREGIPHVYDFPNAPVYAIIPKEDYWNNNPNYTFIDDTVTDAVS